jgi:hypothetical protein
MRDDEKTTSTIIPAATGVPHDPEIIVHDAGDDPDPRTPSDEWLVRKRLAKGLKTAAQQLDVPPQYEAGNHVHCRGEGLSQPIYWQGRQWAVTPFGIECRDGTYAIEKERIWEKEDRHAPLRQNVGRSP